MTNVTLLEKGLRPLGHSSSLLSVLGCSASAPQHVRAHNTKLQVTEGTATYRTMRSLAGLLLVSGAAGLQLHKGIKLAAPALPVALLPASALAAADSYEYGSA